MNTVIIGAGYAGMLAALRLAGKSRGTRVTLVNASDTFVERIRLHEWAAGKAPRPRSIPALLRGTNVAFVHARVTAVDPSNRSVTVESDAGTRNLSYDRLIYALGSYPDLDAIPGGREHALTLGSVDSSLRLRAALEQNPAARVVICGGGLTGIELATETAETYPQARITLLTSSELGPRLSKKGHSYLLDGFKRRKITVREGVAVTKIEAGAVLAADGSRIEADVIISTVGFAVSPLAREAGLTTTPNGQIRVDPYLRSLSHPEIYAVGDAAATGLRMSCAAGMPVAAHAADNIIAEERGSALQPFRFGFAARCISLGRHDALIQRVNADDSPIDQIFTGRVGAAFKEFICRFAFWSLGIERRYPGAYRWLKSDANAQVETWTRQHA